MKIMDDFCYEWKPSRAYHKIDTFCGEQRWMGHKGGQAKGTSQAEVMANSEKIKPVALSYASLKASGRQFVS